jgi:hypothetical protein
MKKFLAFAFVLLLPRVSPAAPVTIACQSPVEEWIKTAATVQPSTKTCQVTVTRTTTEGACAKTERHWYSNPDGSRYFEDDCVLWKTVTWLKQAVVLCGGIIVLDAKQTCTATNTDRQRTNAAFAPYDHAVGSVFIEQMAQLGFRMTRSADNSEGTRFYFER